MNRCILILTLMAVCKIMLVGFADAQVVSMEKSTNKVETITAEKASASPRWGKFSSERAKLADKRSSEKSIPGYFDQSSGLILVDFLTEDFESGIVPPSGWTLNSTSSYTWEICSINPYEGYYYATCYYDPDLNEQNEWLITPVIDFTSAGEDLRVEFYWNMSYYWAVDPYDNYDLELWISTDGGSNFTTMLWCEDSLGEFTNWTWYNATVFLSDYIGEAGVKLAWRYFGLDGAQANLDMISVTDSGIPDGDICETALVIPESFPYTDSVNSCDYNNDYEDCSGADVVYVITLTQQRNLTISLCNSPDPYFDTYLYVFADGYCGNTDSSLYDDDDYCVDPEWGTSEIHGVTFDAGTYYIIVDAYLGECDTFVLDIIENPSGIDDENSFVPGEFVVFQNYPNPFNAVTEIKYVLPFDSFVKIEVFDILGREIATLIDEYQSAGYKSVIWNGLNNKGYEASSGVYLYRFSAVGKTLIKQMVLIK